MDGKCCALDSDAVLTSTHTLDVDLTCYVYLTKRIRPVRSHRNSDDISEVSFGRKAHASSPQSICNLN